MPIDPYAALHALLRAEAVRNAPPAPNPPQAQAQTDEDGQQEERPEPNDR
ncbi:MULTISPECIES: hypothetical protein [unclassified Streptomyces]